MKRFNSALFLASAASMALATAASAQTPPGPNDGDPYLHGAGATAVQEVVWQEQDCLDTSIAARPCPVPGSPLLAGFASNYLPTGSGAGRQAWRNITPQLTTFGSPYNTWDTVQFAFSESSTSASELTQYNTNVGPYGLKPIQVPKFVLPVAIAYNPVYATQGGNQYRFQVNSSFPASTTQINGTPVGGLRLPRPAYCGIFNGTITNWNNATLQTANGGVSLGDPADASWSSVGAPIRLVGRMDRSGTTDIFTRALAAHCSGGGIYLTNAEALPYNRGGAVPNFSSVRADTPYSPTSTAPLAGTTNMIGNQYYNVSTGTILSVPGGLASNPASGASGTGRYLMADGSGAVAAAIAAAPDIGTTRVVNGKVGYIGADFIANAATGNPNLFAAALSRPSAPTTFDLPSAAAASTAIGTILPPESNSTGAFANYPSSPSRSNPLDWVPNLAGSTSGYPITGTTQMLLHTCYKPTNLPYIKGWLGYNVGAPTDVFTNSTTGLLTQSNIGALPAPWQRAVTQTFLTNSTEVSNGQTLGALNLWLAAGGSNHCASVGILPGETQQGL